MTEAPASAPAAEAAAPFPACPQAFGPPAAAALLRVYAEDFRVDEQLGFSPDGEGEHVLVQLEKRGANTQWAARQLAAFAGVAAREVGFCGMKDRHALTRQWFSLPLAGRAEPAWEGLAAEGLRVIASARHRRKLRRGAHAANAFSLTLRDVAGDRADILARVARVREAGVPNYFGEQRYGVGRGNLDAAQAMFAGNRRVRREERGLLISAARSAIFDEVLSRRVAHGDWSRLIDGDVAQLDGSASFFAVEGPQDPALQARLAAFDIHPSGPLWGAGEAPTSGAAGALERAAAARWPTLRDGLERSGSKQQRRALRVRPEGLVVAEHDGGLLRLEFTLPAGSYATSVLREIVRATDVQRLPQAPGADPRP